MDNSEMYQDAAIWVACVFMVALLSALGIIEDAGFAMASGALWIALRTQRRQVNTAHKSETGA